MKKMLPNMLENALLLVDQQSIACIKSCPDLQAEMVNIYRSTFGTENVLLRARMFALVTKELEHLEKIQRNQVNQVIFQFTMSSSFIRNN